MLVALLSSLVRAWCRRHGISLLSSLSAPLASGDAQLIAFARPKRLALWQECGHHWCPVAFGIHLQDAPLLKQRDY